MRTTPSSWPKNGLVAILDALGASSFTHEEIRMFIAARENVLGLLSGKVEELLPDKDDVSIFTFNDTILIVMKTRGQITTLDNMKSFFRLLRKFMVDSLKEGILFRGAVAEGTFYAKDETNTVMGQAVTDAAAWYDKADWMGIHATPRTSLLISKNLETAKIDNRYNYNLIIDYKVPLKDGNKIKVKAVTWPTVFFQPSSPPCETGDSPRSKLLDLLTMHQIPKGTESKYVNTLRFFDYVASLLEKSANPQNAQPIETK